MTETYIIAECALEHRGQMKLAENLIRAAAEAGADCVKFQLYSEDTAKKVDNGHGPLTEYRLEPDEICGLWHRSQGIGLDFLVSAFDMDSLITCKDMGLKEVKIPSVCNSKQEMLEYAAEHFHHIVISTGMVEMTDLEGMVATLKPHTESKNIAVLLCTSIYPCPYENVNLRVLKTMQEKLWCGKIGISDHTVGWEVPVAAVAMGAKIVEKHLTLSRNNSGPDACCSLEPGEFADMVRRIRNVESAMGDGIKKIEKAEKDLLWRKRI